MAIRVTGCGSQPLQNPHAKSLKTHLSPAACSGALGGAAEEAAEGSAKKKRKKGKEEGPAAANGGPTNGNVAALLEQMGRLAKGKALKSSSWAAAVERTSASIVAAAADIGGSGSGKKRKQQGEAAGTGLEAVQRQLQLLAQLPLAHVQPECAAGLAAVAVGSLLCCWEGSSAAGKAGQLATGALPASVACLELLACLAGGSSSGKLEGQQQLMPAVLQAALRAAAQSAAAAAPSEGTDGAVVGSVAAVADHSRHVMQALCTAQLAAGDGSVQQTASQLGAQLEQQQGSQQWAVAVLAQGCLAACHAAAHDASRRAAADILCSSGRNAGIQQQAGAALISGTAASLEASVGAALPAAVAAAAAAGGRGQAGLLAGSLYSCAALLLRMRCCDHPAAEALEQAVGDRSGGVVGTMAAAFQAAASLLGQAAASQPTAATALLAQPLLEYITACCSVTGRMRPAASSSHYASLLALLLHLLGQQPVDGNVPPGRQTIPFAAAFPAAAAAAGGGEGGSAARPLLLDALRELVAGSSSQQLLLPLRYVEAALPAATSSSGNGSSTLPLCELLLMLLEAASGGQQQRLLVQHAERISGLLTGFISSVAYGSLQPAQPAQQLALPGVKQLTAAILAAGQGASSASVAAGEEAPAAPGTPAATAAAAASAAAPSAAEVAALCTALRVLESLAARAKLFQLPAASTSSMVASVAAVWTAYAEQPGAEAGAAAAAALPGFSFRLDCASGAGLFAASCHLLLALLRHRQQVGGLWEESTDGWVVRERAVGWPKVGTSSAAFWLLV